MVTDAARAFDTAGAASVRAQKLQSAESADRPGGMVEIEALWGHADPLICLLAAHAQTITHTFEDISTDRERD
ncbi:hypothetical protein [Amycolatopsis sp. NPDC049868]|uniref:hypothetical protein n=1 Tax=Amycolatopsis sp. NPDC049868 TaxID=3363934 RepID=UPI00379F120C